MLIKLALFDGLLDAAERAAGLVCGKICHRPVINWDILRTGRRIALAVFVCLAVLPVRALAQEEPLWEAKDTIFGSEISPANYPNSTLEEWFGALASISTIGGHASFIWHWGSPDAFDGWSGLVGGARYFGLTILFQMGTTFVNDPSAPPGFANSFGDPDTRARFLEDVQRVALMKPEYLVLTTEVNFLYRFNRPEFENFRTLYTEAYAVIKATSPNTKVGVSHHYAQWVVQRYIDGVDVPAMISPSDFLAFTTYPEDLVEFGAYTSPSDIPAEWFGLARVTYPDARIIFSEVGWSSKAPYSSPQVQAEFMRELPRLMSIAGPELVTWALFTDVDVFQRSMLTEEMIAFLVSLGVDIDGLFIRFNGLGLLTGTGAPKPAFAEAAGMVFPAP